MKMLKVKALLFCVLMIAVCFPPAASETSSKDGNLQDALGGTAAAYDGKNFYIMGGGSSTGVQDYIQKYDPVKKQTSVPAFLPSSRTGGAAVFHNNQIYYLGGSPNGGTEIVQYDPATRQVSTLFLSLPFSILGACGISDGNDIYLFGGTDSFGNRLSDIQKVSIDTTSVSTVANLPQAVTGASCIWDGSNAYIFGGDTGGAKTSKIVKFTVNPPSASNLGVNLPSSRSHTAAAWDGTRAAIYGGLTGGGYTKDIVYFDPQNTTVEKSSLELPSGRAATSAASNGKANYVFGGTTGFNVYVSDIIKHVTNEPPNSPIIVKPSDTDWFTEVPEFQWLFSDPDSGQKQGGYHFQLATDSGFTDILDGRNASSNGDKTYTPASISQNGLLYWRVKIKDNYGPARWGDWSDPQEVHMDDASPSGWKDFAPDDTQTQLSFQASVTVQDSASGLDTDSAEISFSSDGGSSWSSWTAITCSGSTGTTQEQIISGEVGPFNGPSDSGENQIRFRISDVAGNMAESPAYEVQIDAAKPGAPTNLKIEPSNWTNEKTYTISWDNPQDLSGVKTGHFLLDREPTESSTGTSISNGEEYTFNSIPDGEHTLYLWVEDNLGNQDPTAYATGTLYHDGSPPTCTISINEGEKHTNSGTVTIDLDTNDDHSGPSEMLVSNSADLTGGKWEPIPEENQFSWSLSDGDGLKTVYIKIRDHAGNEGDVSEDSINLDTTPPSDCLVTIENGAGYTKSATVSVLLSANDPSPGSGINEYRTSTDKSAWSGWSAFEDSITYEFPSGDGKKHLYVQVSDGAGNIADSVSDEITLDTKPPTSSITPLALEQDEKTFTVSWSGEDKTSDIKSYSLEYKTSLDSTWTSWLTETPKTNSQFEGDYGVTYYLRVRATDSAGNTGTFTSDENGDASTYVIVPEPTVHTPVANSKVSGKVKVTGSADTYVEIKIDDQDWQTAGGIENWDYEFDSTKLDNGKHVLYVRGMANDEYSKEQKITIVVDNEEAQEVSIAMYGMAATIIAIIAVIAGILYYKKIR